MKQTNELKQRAALKTGLVSVSFRDKAPEEIIAAVRECGLDGIEWGADVHVLPGDLVRAHQVRTMTEAAGLEVLAYGSYFKAGVDPVEAFVPVLASAKELGAPCIRVWAGAKGSAAADADDVQRVVQSTQQICEMAAADGIEICYEYHPNTLTDSRFCAVETYKRAAKENLRLYWQPNFCLSPEENMQALSMVLPYLRNVHVFHWDADYVRYPLAQASELWRKFIELISHSETSHSLMLEFVKDDSLTQLKQDAAALLALVRHREETSR